MRPIKFFGITIGKNMAARASKAMGSDNALPSVRIDRKIDFNKLVENDAAMKSLEGDNMTTSFQSHDAEQEEGTEVATIAPTVQEETYENTDTKNLSVYKKNIQESIDKVAHESLKVIGNPSAAIDQVILHSNVTIGNYQESQKICIAEYSARVTAVNDARHSRNELDEIEITSRRNIIRDNELEIERVQAEIKYIEDMRVSRDANFDAAIVSLGETNVQNMASYDKLIVAEKGKLSLLNLPEEVPTSSEKDKGVRRTKKGKKPVVAEEAEDTKPVEEESLTTDDAAEQ